MIHVIVNPLSAGGRAARAWERVAPRVRAEHSVQVHGTDRPGDGARLAADLVRAGVATIVIVGGDGSVHDAVNGVMAVGDPPVTPRLLILPSGSGNDLARALGMPGSPDALLAALRGSTIRLADVWQATWPRGNRWFINVASFGLTARAVGMARWPGGRIAAGRYLIGALKALWQQSNCDVRLSTDGGSSGPMRLAAGVLANGSWFGAGLPVAPGATLDDGRLDVILARAASRPRLLGLLLHVVLGRHLRSPLVQCRRAAELELEWAGDLAFEMDGEAVRVDPPLVIRCQPRAIHFGVPRQSSP